MDPDAKTRPESGSPESHWGPREIEHQPPRDLLLGLGRMVIETRDRLGPDATADEIARDLRARGISVTAEEVTRCAAEPY